VLEVWLAGKQVGKKRPYQLFKTYPICAFSGTLGPKLREGDGQAPEGIYQVRHKQMNPASQFHLSFNLGYPNAFDQAHGYTGSALMVHGNCVSIGCYAMTDAKIEEIYTLMQRAFDAGQAAIPVHAFPFRLSAQTLKAQHTHPAAAFWHELLPIYQAFQDQRVPPEVIVRGKHYQLKTAAQ
jgi:murein L,D-transpeptidase YafK